MLRTVLLISRHDTCRAPLAAALLRQTLPSLLVTSAGLDALPGAGADAHARRWAAQHGLDLQDHRARAVSAALCQRADLLLAMTPGERGRLQGLFPATQDRCFLLGQFRLTELHGPAGDAADVAQACFDDLRGAVRDWADCLGHLVARPVAARPVFQGAHPEHRGMVDTACPPPCMP